MTDRFEKIIDKVEKKLETIEVSEVEIENIPKELQEEFLKEEGELKRKPRAAENVTAKQLEAEKYIKDKDCELEIEIEPDFMWAYGTFYPATGNGKPFDMASVIQSIRKSGIVSGINEALIFKTIQETNRSQTSQKITIASGRMPENSGDSRIELKVNFPIEEKIKFGNDVNDKKILSGAKVMPNEVLAVKYQPSAGRNGYKLNGDIIKAEYGENIPLKAGKNIRIAEEPGIIKFISTIKGIASFEDNQLLKVRPYQDGNFNIDISKDNMNAYLTVIPPFGGGRILESKEIIAEFKNSGIFMEERIKEIRALIHKSLVEGKPIENYLILSGEPPVDGTDAKIIFKVETNPEKRLKQLSDGRIDFRDFNQINTVTKGKVIAEKIAATMGQRDGKDVFGNLIPARNGEDNISIEMGENVTISDDGTKYIATTDGQVKYKFEKLWIDPVYTVKGDLDFSVGNIDFNGDVIINGDVLDGFRISATGNIIVYKNIGAAYILCGSDLIVKGGIITQNKGKIEVKANLHSKFVENSKITVEGDVYVREAILNSYILTNGAVILSEKNRGQIIGGTIVSRKGILARSIGSESEIQTNIYIGHNLIIQNRLKEITAEITMIEKEITEIEKILNILKNASSDVDAYTDKMLKLYKDAVKKKILLKYELIKKFQEKENFFAMQNTIDYEGKISARDTIFPNVNITFRNKNFRIKDKLDYVTLKLNEENKLDILTYTDNL